MGSIKVSNLGKAYKQYPNRWSRLVEWVVPFSKVRHQLHWVLQDLNFEVKPGEALGIIGINGAGKSTLLKMITGTTEPTTGSVNITGRVAALLELGMGFHPEFTGRQNALMAGQLLGYRVVDILRLMPQIEAFADIGDYIDQPVRMYSSGMQMRLAFSVATAHRPDVLIVDEALSVGDAFFQHKSFDRIREYRRQGTTLLIVSHDKAAIQAICDHAILLNAGKIAMQGEPEPVMDYYNALLAEGENATTVRQQPSTDARLQTTSGTGEATVVDILLLNDSNERIEVVQVGQSVRLKVVVQSQSDIAEFVLGYMIKDRLGQTVFGTNTFYLDKKITNFKNASMLEFAFHFSVNLGEGVYSIAIGLHKSHSHIDQCYEWRDLALIFSVVNVGQNDFIGVAWLPPRLEVFS